MSHAGLSPEMFAVIGTSGDGPGNKTARGFAGVLIAADFALDVDSFGAGTCFEAVGFLLDCCQSGALLAGTDLGGCSFGLGTSTRGRRTTSDCLTGGAAGDRHGGCTAKSGGGWQWISHFGGAWTF